MPTPLGGGVASQPLPSGLCEAWEPIYPTGCAMPTGYATVESTALDMATEVLYALTARQFGLCTVTLRPCREECYSSSWWQENNWLPFTQTLTPTASSYWLGMTCGSCTGSNCSCTTVSEVKLPGPVYDVVSVVISGTVLRKDIDYRLDDSRILVRLGDTWPRCNDLNVNDTQPGGWSVTIQQGQPVPTLGRVAVGELALQFMKALLCAKDCILPKPVQSLARQGVNLTFLDPNEVFVHGRTGLYLPDLFIQTYNPDGRRRRARVYNLDDLGTRRRVGS